MFLRDRTNGTVVLVSHRAGEPTTAAGGAWRAASLSADGRFAAFENGAPDLVPGQQNGQGAEWGDVFLFDRATGLNALVSHVAGVSAATAGGSNARVSADGSRVFFTSYHPQLVAGQVDVDPETVPFGETADLFVWERATGTTTLLTHSPGLPLVTGAGSTRDLDVSANGALLYFHSTAPDLVSRDYDGGQTVFELDFTATAGAAEGE
jgi:Tol biopolymer transport system component